MTSSQIHFWNGNKSASRQIFELQLIEHILAAGSSDTGLSVIEDRTDYPDAKDEGDIFLKGIDVCVTIAGNPKFADGTYIPIYEPLMNGLLGHRLIIIRQSDTADFANIKSALQLKEKTIGIPATWADAALFRANGYPVHEEGSLEDLFQRLAKGDFDYVALGVNEIQAIFEQFAKPLTSLIIEPTLRLYYPFALVFYVSPKRPELASRLEKGIRMMMSGGEYQDIFKQHTATIIASCMLNQRQEIRLDNQALPSELSTRMQRAYNDLLNY
ncbi:MAG: transporter substrate-binding domain-containing protein [Gammaproteobacteria bacterium]|nr:transporter substrate-binding domain-containing protein [Gammaproteobacteria bacterium]NNJ73119.1 transporter substrate-binding domain-containing protein [Enterobacterales bacterium]